MSGGRLGHIDYNLLLALAALLDERNVTRASEQVGMSQPAMSAALARLRTHFDDELLIRQSRNYELSPLARSVLPSVHQAVDRVQAVLGGPPSFDPATSCRHFFVSISDYALSVLIEPLLSLVQKRAPHVTVEFDPVPGDGTDIAFHLLRRDVLVGIEGFGFPGRRQRVFSDRLVGIVAKDNRAIGVDVVTAATLASLPRATSMIGPGTGTHVWDRTLEKMGVERPPAITVPGLLALPFAVSGTDLFAVVPERLARRSAEALELALVELPVDAPVIVESAHWHPARSHDPSLRWLLAALGEVSAAIETTE